ncbi:hypothetical protein [Robiginitomaculum antarcticum]|uniref:hypothetical protein n=1 Tax=Robiginitomaculum antarcticum TaxID=437507 RepID=UPI00036B9CF7|nr:hypothetical protein [Robiginitomaculum antarcticum]
MHNKQSLINRLKTGGPRPLWIRYFLLIGFFFLIMQMLLSSVYGKTALVYIFVPYLVGVAIYLFIPQPKGLSKTSRFARHMLAVIIVMLGTSALLREGIICVAMFLPIYLFFSALYFAIAPARHEPDDPKTASDVFKSSVIPLIVAVLSLEGVTQTLSFDREETVSRTMVVEGNVDTLKSNMAMPIHLEEDRSLFLRLFPLPYDVAAGTLSEGDTHIAKFAYHRWMFTNTHYGETRLKLAEIGPRHIRTQITTDTTYFSKYMTIHGTRVDFEPVTETTTRVTLTINYRRDLDPAWYFGPLQRRAMRESADYLITQVIARPIADKP